MHHKLTEEQAEALLFEDYDQDIYEVIEIEDFSDNDGNGSYSRVIFRHESNTYALHIHRYGSYYTNFDYDFELNCPQVERLEVIKHIWSNVP